MQSGLLICTTILQPRRVIIKGWKKAGVMDLVSGELTLSPEDPYDKFYP